MSKRSNNSLPASLNMNRSTSTSGQRLALVERVAHIGTWEWDIATGAITWSDEIYRIYGMEPQARHIDADFVKSRMAATDVTTLDAAVAKAVEGATLLDHEYRIQRMDGRWRICRCLAETTINDDGELIWLEGVLQDVTELRESESLNRRLGRILDESSNEILVFDAETLRLIQVNQGARDNLGYTDAELVGMTPMDLSPNMRSRADFERRVASLRSGERDLLVFEGGKVRKDGSHYPVEVRLQLSRAEHPPVFVAVVQDITERKELARLQEEFVSIVSHELRTPLTPVTGVLSLLARGDGGELSERAQQMVDLALRNSQRLMYLIDDLLDMRKMSTGTMEFDIEEVDLAAIVADAVEVNANLASDEGVRVELGRRADGLLVDADRERLTQVVTNLLTNAAKFSPPGGVIEVGVERVGDAWGRVSVTDHGPGIPADFQDRVFDKFAQADTSSTRTHGGTGLGLTIAKAIVERLGGRIDFETAPGEGTRFFFDLPLVTDGTA